MPENNFEKVKKKLAIETISRYDFSMVNQSSSIAPRFLPVVCRCERPFGTESDCIVGDPTFREIVFCVSCGRAIELDDAIFQARVEVAPKFDHDMHVLDYVVAKLEA